MRADDLATIAARLNATRTVFVFTHESADGDALGTMVALVLFFRSLGKEAYAFVPGRVQSAYRFLGTDDLINTLTLHEAEKLMCRSRVTCLSADAADADRLGEWKQLFLAGVERLVVDHHNTNAGFGDIHFVDETASSCCEVLYELFTIMDGSRIDTRVASALYTGLISDTGSFQYSNTTTQSLTHGAQLIALGARPDEISRTIHESKPYGALKLMGACVSSARLMYGGRVVIGRITRAMLESFDCIDEDTEGVTDELRRVENTRAVVLLREAADGKVKVSLRGKYGFDVKRVATAFGGGGHLLAAGCTIDSDVDEAEERVLVQLDRYLGTSRI